MKRKHTIVYNIVDSCLAGGMVFIGSLTGNGFNVTAEGIVSAVLVAASIAFYKFNKYWKKRGDYTVSLFNFA